MALSPNYSWAEPDNSSLVKNGAQDIRALGDAIDTSVWNIGFGQAGKNKIINGDFGIWQRGTSFTQAAQFSADRYVTFSDSTATISQQTFTPGTAPVTGYEGTYFLRSARSAGGTYANILQKIEDVRVFANQTMTISFWAKSSVAQTVTVRPQQNFGSGGSSAVNLTVQTANVTTSWARYSLTFSIPSISGKTIGTGSYLSIELYWLTAAAVDMDLWGIQAEYGAKATPFETATGTIQGELAACQRYFFKTSGIATYSILATGVCASTTQANAFFYFPVTMRTSPTVFDNSSLYVEDSGGGAGTSSTVTYANQTTNTVRMNITGLTGLTANRPCHIFTNNSNLGYISASAEL